MSLHEELCALKESLEEAVLHIARDMIQRGEMSAQKALVAMQDPALAVQDTQHSIALRAAVQRDVGFLLLCDCLRQAQRLATSVREPECLDLRSVL